MPIGIADRLSQEPPQYVNMDQSQNTPQQPTQTSAVSWSNNNSGFSGSFARTPGSASSSNHTFFLPTSPSKKSRASEYKPKIARTCGQRPACLVNASVTYCGNNQIYAFGGFDQYTDEGLLPSTGLFVFFVHIH